MADDNITKDSSFLQQIVTAKEHHRHSMEEGNNAAFIMLAGYLFYLLLILLGIPANLFVLVRMLQFRRRKPDVYRSGTGICLLAMSIADLVSLAAIFSSLLLSFGIAIPLQPNAFSLMCKLTIFAQHTATSVAVWSWLVMSILRWLALYRPFVHRTLYNLPQQAMLLVTSMACILNAFLLMTVQYDPEMGVCTQNWLLSSELLTRCLLLLESACSFAVPILVVVYLDTSTLIFVPRLLSGRCNDKLLQDSSMMGPTESQLKKSTRTLLRWLAIALVDLLLNTPENLLRLATILDLLPPAFTSSETYFLLKTLSDVLYYSQYSFNAAYLALFICDRATSSYSTVKTGGHSCSAAPVQPHLTRCSSRLATDPGHEKAATDACTVRTLSR